MFTSCGKTANSAETNNDFTESLQYTSEVSSEITDATAPVTTSPVTTSPVTTNPPIDTTGDESEGRFVGDLCEIEVVCVSGTKNAFVLEGHTLRFNKINEDSVYSVSGKLNGNIIIDIGDEYKLDLELKGLSLISSSTNPIAVLSGDKVSITAKKDFENYIYDDRAPIENEEDKKAAIYSESDLNICGKGTLTVISQYNNGIHTKDDLEVKNLNLYVRCCDNALKGNDSVTINSGSSILIATTGDTVKTSNSSISDKGKQKGNVTINGGNHTLYAACDGIDAAHDVSVNNDSTALNIFTDKYSEYSEEVTAVSEDLFYIRFTSPNYTYSVKFINDSGEFVWANAHYHSKAGDGWSQTYYYYSLERPAGYNKMQVYIYSKDMAQGQDVECLTSSDVLTVNDSYDTFALSSRNNSISYSWTNYTTQVNNGFGGMGRPGGMGGGGFQDGNTDKVEYSTKGIKAANEIVINGGFITVKSYDDALHANNDGSLENGNTPKGDITINGGTLELYSNDDGIHADATLTVNGGNINLTNSYEGLEGNKIILVDGMVSVIAKDDGINATASSGTGVHIKGGYLYIYCTGDGIDSNSRTSYSGIVFDEGNVLVISNSGGNSAIDTEQGYTYNGGKILAIMPQRGMTNEAVHCKNFSSVGVSKNFNLTNDSLYSITNGDNVIVTFKSPVSLSSKVIFIGNNTATINASSDASLDANGVKWY